MGILPMATASRGCSPQLFSPLLGLSMGAGWGVRYTLALGTPCASPCSCSAPLAVCAPSLLHPAPVLAPDTPHFRALLHIFPVRTLRLEKTPFLCHFVQGVQLKQNHRAGGSGFTGTVRATLIAPPGTDTLSFPLPAGALAATGCCTPASDLLHPTPNPPNSLHLPRGAEAEPLLGKGSYLLMDGAHRALLSHARQFWGDQCRTPLGREPGWVLLHACTSSPCRLRKCWHPDRINTASASLPAS